jgi:hypothetical protein
MRVLALVPYLYDTAPGQRFRLEQWEPFWRTHGVQTTFAAFESPGLHRTLHRPGHWSQKSRFILQAFGRRARLLRDLEEYDVVIVHREAAMIGPPLFESAFMSRAFLSSTILTTPFSFRLPVPPINIWVG